MHPWHWLGYGQNAAIIQALTAIGGVIGLAKYVADTNRIMRSTEQTRIDAMTPYLTVYEEDLPAFTSTTVRKIWSANIGGGAATGIAYWSQEPPPRFRLGDWIEETPDPCGRTRTMFPADSSNPGVRDFYFRSKDLNVPRLFLIHFHDARHEIHQLQMLQPGDGTRRLDTKRIHRPWIPQETKSDKVAKAITRIAKAIRKLDEASKSFSD